MSVLLAKPREEERHGFIRMKGNIFGRATIKSADLIIKVGAGLFIVQLFYSVIPVKTGIQVPLIINYEKANYKFFLALGYS
jgi:hypothetical protein